MNVLHVYGQIDWHDDAWIVGDRKSLEDLRDAIDTALKEEHGTGVTNVVFVNDGEGYILGVKLVENPEILDKLAVPYSDELAAEDNKEAIWPWELQNKDNI